MKEEIGCGCIVSIICGSLTVILLTMIIIEQVDWRKIDSLDNYTYKSVEIVAIVEVRDKNYDGFEVIYTTANAVTTKRLEEIRSRSHIWSSLHSMARDAEEHFGDMLDTDIYEFLDFILPYNPDPDVKINRIMVGGAGKKEMYSAPNPGMAKAVTWINSTILQGMQYINFEDIYQYRNDSTFRRYRYWKCPYPWQESSTDERFSHFDEEHQLTGDESRDRLIRW